jgi:hypothetical protein
MCRDRETRWMRRRKREKDCDDVGERWEEGATATGRSNSCDWLMLGCRESPPAKKFLGKPRSAKSGEQSSLPEECCHRL